MMWFRLAALLTLIGPLLIPVVAAAQDQPIRGDFRTFRVGLTVDELPAEGYIGFACGQNGAKPGPEIAGWQAYGDCPAEPDGLHEVSFRYDETDVRFESLEGTAIAGHPVLISLLISDAGVVEGIRVFTDPFTNAYHMRRARTMGRKVKARFGMSNFACEALPAEGSEVEVGGVFQKERCRADLGDRTIDLFTQFYRTYASGEEEIVNSVWFEIRQK